MSSSPESFEQAFSALEAIVVQLESGGLGLDETMQLYARGMTLAKSCQDRLEQAELQLTRLGDITASEDRPI